MPAREPTAERGRPPGRQNEAQGSNLMPGRPSVPYGGSRSGSGHRTAWSRKPAAPALNAFVWLLSSGKAVMKMMGTDRPWAIRRFCSSIPLMPGILTSEIRHDVSLERGDSRNSSADPKTWAMNPCRRRNLAVATRTDLSSSTIEIIGALDSRVVLAMNVRREPIA